MPSIRFRAMKALLCLLPALSLPAAGLTVRVLPTPGGPQIHVDGAVAPRFFWGAMSGGSLQVGEQWADYSFDFRPGINVDRQGTLHLRFGHLAGSVDVADLRVRDTQTSEDILAPGSFGDSQAFARTWNTWPPAPANTVGKWELSDGALHVTLAEPPGGDWPDFHFHSNPSLSFRADRAYRCTFRARASPGRNLPGDLPGRQRDMDKHRWPTRAVPHPSRSGPRRRGQSGLLRRAGMLGTARKTR